MNTIRQTTLHSQRALLLSFVALILTVDLSSSFVAVTPQSRRLATLQSSHTLPLPSSTASPSSLWMAESSEDDASSSDDSAADSSTGGDDNINIEDTTEEAVEVETDAVIVESDDGTSVEISTVPAWKRIVLFWKYNKKEDDGLTFRQKLGKAGLSVVLSYGFVSNMSYCVSVSAAWYIFCKKTLLSPLAPGQWPKFLAVYSGFWVFNNFVRPIRFGLSVAISTQFDKVVQFIQNKFRVNKSVAIGLTVFLANIVGTTTLMCLGISIAARLAGVPVFAK